LAARERADEVRVCVPIIGCGAIGREEKRKRDWPQRHGGTEEDEEKDKTKEKTKRRHDTKADMGRSWCGCPG
jgi:hypothetical protein